MRSWDPMRNFPELDAPPRDEARALVIKTQREVSRRPPILIGLIATLVIAGVVIFNVGQFRGVNGGLFIGALIAVFGVAYMVVVIKPRMQAEFRKQGFPR